MDISKRIETIIDKQQPQSDALMQTVDFVKEVLGPYKGRYDMTYRYEHSLRVAAWGQKIAREAGLPEVPLVMACVLHDVGYPECSSMEELHLHPQFSEVIARKYLQHIQYDQGLTDQICRGILYHDRWNNMPEGMTAFEISVNDADDLDRFDVLRQNLLGNSDIGENMAKDVAEKCRRRLRWEADARGRACGTEAAKKFWLERMDLHHAYFSELLRQMESTDNILE